MCKDCFSSLGAEIAAQVTEDGDGQVDGVAEQMGDIKIKEQDGRSAIFKSMFLNFLFYLFCDGRFTKNLPVGREGWVYLLMPSVFGQNSEFILHQTFLL